MNEQDQQLAALTDQRLTITLGGKQYRCRRPSLKDVAAVNAYRFERLQQPNTANVGLDTALFAITELMKPDTSMTPDELANSLPLRALAELETVMEQLDFKQPQKQAAPAVA